MLTKLGKQPSVVDAPVNNSNAKSLLIARQIEVLELMAQGLPNKSISRKLDLAEGTVKLHVAAIIRAMDARNRTHAVTEASRRGMISIDDQSEG